MMTVYLVTTVLKRTFSGRQRMVRRHARLGVSETRVRNPVSHQRACRTFSVRSPAMSHLLGYARVSTAEQDPALQDAALRKAGCARVWTDVRVQVQPGGLRGHVVGGAPAASAYSCSRFGPGWHAGRDRESQCGQKAVYAPGSLSRAGVGGGRVEPERRRFGSRGSLVTAGDRW